MREFDVPSFDADFEAHATVGRRAGAATQAHRERRVRDRIA
jgi:hypothetical protein